MSDGDVNQFRLFVGPKDVDLLKSIDPKLEQLVDFGWLAVLAKPLFLIVNWANDQHRAQLRLGHHPGHRSSSISRCSRCASRSMKSMRKMQALKPQIDAINAKYKGMSVRDPKKAEQTQETMDLYKKNGVNPMGGCLPMVLQLPILVSRSTGSSRFRWKCAARSWLWVTIFRSPKRCPSACCPSILIATQFLTQKMMPQPGADPAQQQMIMFMPLIFGFMFYNFASGLVLYYLTSNLVGMG